MKIYEKILKSCIGSIVEVVYGRCITDFDPHVNLKNPVVAPCRLEGTLVAFDNLCIVVENEEGLWIVNKSNIQSIFLPGKKLKRNE